MAKFFFFALIVVAVSLLIDTSAGEPSEQAGCIPSSYYIFFVSKFIALPRGKRQQPGGGPPPVGPPKGLSPPTGPPPSIGPPPTGATIPSQKPLGWNPGK